MTTQQPEALRLADALESRYSHNMECSMNAAAELRRLHESNQELLTALKAVYETCDWHGDDGHEAMWNARVAIAKGEAK